MKDPETMDLGMVKVIEKDLGMVKVIEKDLNQELELN